jgi:hypothetical protein
VNIIVTTQAEWDALPPAYEDYTVIDIRSTETITVRKVPGSSSVVARESSSVEARGSSSVVAWAQSSTHHKSTRNPELHGQAVCFLYDGYGQPIRKSDTCTVIPVVNAKGVAGWLERESVI